MPTNKIKKNWETGGRESYWSTTPQRWDWPESCKEWSNLQNRYM